MFYDDGYDPDKEKIKDEELRLATELEIQEGRAARAYKLSNGTVFTVKGKNSEYTLEFEDGLLYEVAFKLDDQSNQYSYNNGEWVKSKYERTRKVYTVDEINNLIKG